MEISTKQKSINSKKNIVSTVPIRVKRETKKRLQSELAKVNKKQFGRKVRLDALIDRAVSLLTEADLLNLQQASLSNVDRLEIKYREFVKTNATISKDEFIGLILTQTN